MVSEDRKAAARVVRERAESFCERSGRSAALHGQEVAGQGDQVGFTLHQRSNRPLQLGDGLPGPEVRVGDLHDAQDLLLERARRPGAMPLDGHPPELAGALAAETHANDLVHRAQRRTDAQRTDAQRNQVEPVEGGQCGLPAERLQPESDRKQGQ